MPYLKREDSVICQAIPRKVLKVEVGRAEVLFDGRPTWVMVNGITDLVVGEYVLVYAGCALERLSTEDALELLRFLDELEQLFTDKLQ